jgi:hypothetical protein
MNGPRDLMHTVQAEAPSCKPFIRGSGPWEIYFRDRCQAQGMKELILVRHGLAQHLVSGFTGGWTDLP